MTIHPLWLVLLAPFVILFCWKLLENMFIWVTLSRELKRHPEQNKSRGHSLMPYAEVLFLAMIVLISLFIESVSSVKIALIGTAMIVGSYIVGFLVILTLGLIKKFSR